MATTTFDNLITFSRGSNATVTGPNGLIQWAPSNQLLNSQDLEAAYWTKLNATITANTSVAPDGSITAETLTSTSSVSATTGVYRGISFTSGHTASVYVKAGTSNIAWVSSNTGESYAVFNLATGVVIEAGNATASILAVGNGWYRIAAANTTVAGTFFIVGGKDAYTTGHPWANGTWTSGNTILVWGAQLELGSTATTYNNTSVRNLLGFSEASDNAAWTKIGTSIVTGAQANPVNGLFNAQKLMEDTANSGHQINQGATTTANPFTFSTYAKPAGRNWMALGITDSGSTVRISYFDLANGVTGTVASGVTASIVSVGNGWYRCAVTVAAAAAGANVLRIYATNANNNTTYTGDGNSGVYIYGAQLSNSASLDPYAPTPGAAPSSTAYYGPRFDYDPVTLAPRGFLVEEARTNLLTYSDQIDNAAWTKTAATVTANANTAPDGTLTADKLVEDATTAQHRASQAATTTAVAHTFSCYVKAAERNFAALYHTQTNSSLSVNLTTGATGTISGTVAPTASNVTAVGNGWFRISMTVNATAASNGFAIFILNDLTAGSYAGTAGSGIFIWGAQLEAGAFATSYIPTVASTVTRSADVATINGSLFSQWYGQPEGTWVSEASTFKPTSSSAAGVVLRAQDGGSPAAFTDTIYNVADINARVSVGGVTQASFTVAYTASAVDKVAQAYRTNDFAAARNGSVIGTDNSGSVSTTIDRMGIGSAATGSLLPLNGHIRSINFIPARAADFQLQALTT